MDESEQDYGDEEEKEYWYRVAKEEEKKAQEASDSCERMTLEQFAPEYRVAVYNSCMDMYADLGTVPTAGQIAGLGFQAAFEDEEDEEES